MIALCLPLLKPETTELENGFTVFEMNCSSYVVAKAGEVQTWRVEVYAFLGA